jgi:hypothetical protein
VGYLVPPDREIRDWIAHRQWKAQTGAPTAASLSVDTHIHPTDLFSSADMSPRKYRLLGDLGSGSRRIGAAATKI